MNRQLSSPRRRRMLGWLLAGLAPALMVRNAAAAPRVIPIHARKFVFTPDRIVMKPGEAVVFEFTTDDVLMGFSAPDLGVRADLIPGQVVRLAATAGKAGKYAFLCDIFCGSGHETMGGTIEVG